DIGRTTNDAIIRFEEGYSPEKCGGKAEFDNGNGAIMRIAPLAFILLYNEFDFVKEVEMIKRYTEITHAHPRVIVGSIHAPFLE
ncbi:ADP-ribosylglycohydrolase, partial [Bacillus pseudomycoides]